MEGKVNVKLSELVVKLDETKFECISSNADVIDRMKIQKVKFPPKSGMSYFREVSLVYVRQDVARAKTSVLVTPVLRPVSSVTHHWSGEL